MKTAYVMEDSSKATWRGFEDWVAVPNKGLNVLEVFSEFESRFGMLSTHDRALLVADKVVLFLRAVDVRDRHDLGTLLEDTTTESGLTSDWEVVKTGVTRFTKRRQWLAGEEKKNAEPMQRSRPTMESLQPQTRDVPAQIGVDASVLEQLLKGIEDLKIAGIRRADERPSTSDRRCIWCDDATHDWRRCDEYKEALRRDLIYYEGNRIHSMDSRKPLRTNYRKGGMKKILEEEIAARNSYVSTLGIRVGDFATTSWFWPKVLEAVKESATSEIRSKADEVREATGWECPVDRTSVEALCQIHEVFMDEKRRRMEDEGGSSRAPESRGKTKGPAFKVTSEIEQRTDLQKVFEEKVLDSRVEFSLRELLGIAKREFHDLLVDLVKRKRQSMEDPSNLKVNASSILMNDAVVEDELPESHYTKSHWARATTETPVRLGEIKEPVIALIDHGSEINLMSREVYRKGKWPINTDHGWKIRAATKSSEDLFGACPAVTVKIGDVEVEQNFFVQDELSHSVILGQPFITASRMETKVLDSGAAFARVRNQSGSKSVQFLTVSPNHGRNKRELVSRTKPDF
jgi:hypothetical protein